MFQMYMYCLKQVNISVVSLDFTIYNTSQYASFLVLNLHSLPFRHNRALIAQIIIQNTLPENVSCPRFLNCFVNSLIYSKLLIVSVHGQLTLHCTAEQPSRTCTTWVPWFTEFLSSENTMCQVWAGSARVLAKLPPLHSAGTDLCYCKKQLIRAVRPPGNYPTFYK